MGTLEIGTGIRNFPLPQIRTLSPSLATCLILCHPPVPCGVDPTYVGSIRTVGAGLACPLSSRSMDPRRRAWICRSCAPVTLNCCRHSCTWGETGLHLGKRPSRVPQPQLGQDSPAQLSPPLTRPDQHRSLGSPRAGLSAL